MAELATTPKGKPGRPSKALTLKQAMSVLEHAERTSLHAYVALSLLTKAAGIGENWTPREMRHSFVSILSGNGVRIEEIADLVGHKSTVVTEKVYRRQLKPVISSGAVAMNTIFATKTRARLG